MFAYLLDLKKTVLVNADHFILRDRYPRLEHHGVLVAEGVASLVGDIWQFNLDGTVAQDCYVGAEGCE